ncbi:MAG: esterase/lipase [Candidatus Azotimanducaceae bacterium]|jgi:esterase/lipase
MPVLLITGTKDTGHPAEHMHLLLNAIASESKELKLIEGAPHTYTSDSDLGALEKIMSEWIVSVV